MNYLFVCSRNRWRSRTAETIFKNNGEHQIRSAGTAANARVKISSRLACWADVIFVMEMKHAEYINRHFENTEIRAEIITLHIEDNYKYMDSELIDILKYDLRQFFKSD